MYLILGTIGDTAEWIGRQIGSFLIVTMPFILFIIIGYFAYKFLKKKKINK